MEIEAIDSLSEDIKTNMQEEQIMHMEPERYVMQTLDDAALVLTVCRLSLQKARLLPSQRSEVYMRLTKVRDLLDAVDSDVAQSSTIVDSSMEGN